MEWPDVCQRGWTRRFQWVMAKVEMCVDAVLVVSGVVRALMEGEIIDSYACLSAAASPGAGLVWWERCRAWRRPGCGRGWQAGVGGGSRIHYEEGA